MRFQLCVLVLLGLVTAARAETRSPFPSTGLMPKVETGALQFVADHPEWDGRGVVVAIFDTGVDPGAEGLQNTSTGQPKLIDMVDGTGSGDVPMGRPAAPADGCLEGLSGRKLRLRPSWIKPGRKFRLGIKAAYDFFPSGLVSRLKRERRKDFDRVQADLEESLRREILRLESGAAGVTAEQKKRLPELKERLSQLNQAAKSYQDPGPVYDCVVFHDGSVWRAVVDTDEDGDLADETAMANYRLQKQWDTFAETQMNFAVNIYQDGDCLSLVVDSEAHGTHVGGIVAGHYPNEPELNGVAPGAQLVSVKIGDPRLGGMETASGMLRGLRAVLDNHCDLVNMSFGEPTTRPNAAWLSDMLTELVREHNVVFVSSAGNDGPALSTVGAPGGTTSAVIGVGAYISPQMAKAEYAVRDELPDNAYTWSSRGPTFDGDWGVDIFAPGGAFSPVPQWTLNRNMQMNGTSMASPNACGSIALMLSAAKSQKVKYSPSSVLRALQNTARTVELPTRYAQGPGLLQVNRAAEYLVKHTDAPGEQLPFDVRVMNRHGARGIYLREADESQHPSDHVLMIKPMLPEEASPADSVRMQFRFAIQSTQSWVQAPDHLMMARNARTLNVRIDPTKLPPGLHTAEVLGLDAQRPARGPLWRLPITVLVPHHRLPRDAEDSSRFIYSGTCDLQTGEIARRYFEIPRDAAWACLRLHRTDTGPEGRMIVHAVQTVAGHPYRDTELKQYIRLAGDHRWENSFKVQSGRMLEVCIGQYWSNPGGASISYELEVFGLHASQQAVALSDSVPYSEVVLTNSIGRTRVMPQAAVKSARWSIRPAKSQLAPRDSARDRMPDGRVLYGLTLDYEFTMESAASVTPQFPVLEHLLYDSPFAGHIWILLDSGKRRVAVGDWRAEPVRLTKGDFTLRLLLVHNEPKQLENWRQLPLVLERTLPNPITVKAYAGTATAAKEESTFGGTTLEHGQQARLYFRMPRQMGLPSWLEGTAILVGDVRYSTDDGAPAFPLTIAAGGPKKSATAAVTPAVDDDLAIVLRDARLAHLKKIASKGNVEEVKEAAAAMLKDFPDYLPVYAQKLAFLDQESHRKEHLSEIVQAADEVLSRIDPAEVRTYFAGKPEPKSAEEKKRHRSMTEQRDLLIDTLYRKGRALGYMELPDVVAKHPIDDPDAHDKAFEENFAELQKWVDTSGEKYYLLQVRREKRRGNYAKALALLNRHLGSSPPEEKLFKKRRDLYELLDWEHLVKAESLWLHLRFPEQPEEL